MYNGTWYNIVLCLYKCLVRKTCLSWRFGLAAQRVSGPWHIKCEIGKQIDKHAILHRNLLFRTYKQYHSVWINNFRSSFSISVHSLWTNMIEGRISNIYYFGEENAQTCKILHTWRLTMHRPAWSRRQTITTHHRCIFCNHKQHILTRLYDQYYI